MEYKGQVTTIPITCVERIDPRFFTQIYNENNELELEEEEDVNPQKYFQVQYDNNAIIIEGREYLPEQLQYYEDEIAKGNKSWKGPGPCWCIKDLNESEICEDCQILVGDITTYQYQRDSLSKGIFANKAQFEEGDIYIQFDKDRQTTCGELNPNQEKLLHTFLDKNKDAFATTVEELNQSDQY